MAIFPKALIFDLGGVLVGFDGIGPLVRLSRGRLDTEGARRFWIESPWVRTLETGKCSPLEFARGVTSDAGFDISAEDFLQQFASWEKGYLPGALEILQALKGRIPLACLSNNNEMHWGILQRRYQVGSCFDHLFLSHKIGMMKPDRGIYEYVLQNLAMAAGEVIFFDDNPACVRGAVDAGIRAIQVNGPLQVRKALQELGIHLP